MNTIFKALYEQIKLNDIKIVSFDIFDTIIFRTVEKPTDIFLRMYYWKPDLFPDDIDAEIWKGSRIRAERFARKESMQCKNGEVTLESIYEKLPEEIYSNREQLMECEILCEEKSCFVNEEIYECMGALHDAGIKIILISDMYLSSTQILRILRQNGFDEQIINGVYISSEYDISKRKRGLYEIALSDCKILPNELLHVGDNYYSDIGVPSQMEIYTYPYMMRSDAYYMHPFLYYEAKWFESPIGELLNMRIIATQNDYSGNEKKWYELGAMVLGPLFAYAAEWVLDEAEKHQIQTIRPFMREGEFLTALLQNAACHRETSFSIQPLYVSRFALFRANLERASKEDIEYLLKTYNMTVGKALDILGITDLCTEYREYFEVNSINTKSMVGREDTVFEELVAFLIEEDILEEIHIRNREYSNDFLKYLEQMEMMGSAITLDIGWRGSMQRMLQSFLENKNVYSQLKHMLLFYRSDSSESEFVWNVKAYIGRYGSSEKYGRTYFPRLMELFLLSTEGTTIGYRREGEKVVPITQKISYSAEQIAGAKRLQEGILSFQKIYHKMVVLKPYIRRISPMKVARTIERLLTMPLSEEAELFKVMEYDQNFGANTMAPIIKANSIERRKLQGEVNYYSHHQTQEVTWNCGMNVLADSGYILKKMAPFQMYEGYSILFMLERALNCAGGSPIVIVGAGTRGRVCLQLAAVIGCMDQIDWIVDNDPNIEGAAIGGIPIMAVDSSLRGRVCICPILNRVICKQLIAQITELTDGNVKIIHFFEDEQ